MQWFAYMGYCARNKQRSGKKNQTQRTSGRRPTTMSRKNGFENGQQYNNILETARGRHVMLVDERIDALKLSTLLTQVKYNLILRVNVDK